jgi:hypothetical protein
MTVPIGGGTPSALVSGVVPLCVAVDGVFAYYTNYSAGTVSRVPIGGGASVVIASGQSDVNAVTTDATAIYWTTDLTGTVMKLAK